MVDCEKLASFLVVVLAKGVMFFENIYAEKSLILAASLTQRLLKVLDLWKSLGKRMASKIAKQVPLSAKTSCGGQL